jgi:hypothetical protein
MSGIGEWSRFSALGASRRRIPVLHCTTRGATLRRGMDWRRVPLTEHMTEAAYVVSAAEVVIEFSPEARGWFEVRVFEDLRATDAAERFFARAEEKDDRTVQGLGSGATPEEAATIALREAGVSLRRARGR